MRAKEKLRRIKILYIPLLKIRQVLKRFIITIKFSFTKMNRNCENKELIILGTGPSLKTDISKIIAKRQSCFVMAVNSFTVDENFLSLKPEYYVLADPCYFSDSVAGIGKEDRDVFIKTITGKLSWKMTVILPEEGRESYLVKALADNSFITFKFINGNCTYMPYFVNKFRAYNKNIAMPWVQNVLQMCLYFAILQHFPKSYLYGADHNWCKYIMVNNDNIVCIEENHCYEAEHHRFHAIEKVDGSYWTMGELFEAWTKVYNGYYEINEYANYNNVKIINCSSVSFIDAFERGGGVFQL